MKKNFRMLTGIILHPFKMLYELTYRKSENDDLARSAAQKKWYADWDRMHRMSSVTGTAYTESPLYENLTKNKR